MAAEEDHRQAFIDETTTGSAWMFYNHYNPELTRAMQRLIVGDQVEDVVNGLLEKTEEV